MACFVTGMVVFKEGEENPMSRRSKFRRHLIYSFGACIALAFLLFGQHKEQFAQAQKENGAALKQYTWKSRTELKLKGESKNVKLEQVRYDLDGKLQKTNIGAPAAEQAEQQSNRRGRGRVKEKIVEKKKGEFAELMKALGQLAGSYAHMSPEALQKFAQNAGIGQGEGPLQGTVQIRSGDVLQAGDVMSVWVDPATYHMRQVEIHSIYDEKPVKVLVEFRRVEDGPSYPAHSTLSYPDKEIELIVENYDYERVSP